MITQNKLPWLIMYITCWLTSNYSSVTPTITTTPHIHDSQHTHAHKHTDSGIHTTDRRNKSTNWVFDVDTWQLQIWSWQNKSIVQNRAVYITIEFELIIVLVFMHMEHVIVYIHDLLFCLFHKPVETRSSLAGALVFQQKWCSGWYLVAFDTRSTILFEM